MATYWANADWSALGGDPAPGDVGTMQTMASRYAATADAIRTASTKLNAIKDEGTFVSGAVDEFKKLSGKTGEQIMRAHGRYQKTAEKTRSYATELAELQGRAADALQKAKDQQAAATSAAQSATMFESNLPDEPSEAESTRLRQLQRDATNATTSATSAGTAGSALASEWMTLGNKYAKEINMAIDDDVKTSGWDHFVDFMNAIGKIADVVAQVAGILALVLAWVPILGQALAAIALVAGLVSLLAKTLNAIDTGEGWGDVLWAAIGVATGALGKLLGPILKSTKMDLIKNLVTKPGTSAAGRSRAAFGELRKQGSMAYSRNKLMMGELKSVVGSPWKTTKSFFAGIKKYGTDIKTDWTDMRSLASSRLGLPAGAKPAPWETIKSAASTARYNVYDEAFKYSTNPYQFFATKSVGAITDLTGAATKGSVFFNPANLGVTVMTFSIVGVNVSNEVKKRFQYSGGNIF